MPRKLLKRFMIAEKRLLDNKTLRYVSSSILQHNVWHLNRHSASKAVFIGLFWAFIPMPLQMIPAAFFCILAKANLPLSIALVWLTNPVTMPPVFYAAYKLGAFILETSPIVFQLDLEWITGNIHLIWKPLILGSFIFAITFSSIGYTVIHIAWRWTTISRWKQRKKRRQRHS